VETADSRPEEVESELRRFWSPSASWKSETIGERYKQALTTKQEKAALCDSSPIISVGLKSETELRLVHAMGRHDPRPLGGGLIEGFDGVRPMLGALRDLLDTRIGETSTLVGHNFLKFDAPKLRHAFIEQGIRLPGCLAAKHQPTFDTMVEARRFSLQADLFISVDDLAGLLNVGTHKGTIDGAAIPELYAAHQVEAIISYNLLDVLAEEALFLRMTGAVGS